MRSLPVLLASTLLASVTQAQTPRFNLTGDTLLSDARLHIVLTGVKPASLVTIRLEGPNGRQASNATFIADRAGNIDLATAVPVAGSYATADAMGLFWSLQRSAGVGGPPANPPVATAATPWQLTAEVRGVVVATDTLWRRLVAAGVRVTRIREPGLSGDYYDPPGAGPHAAVIVLPGSQGGTVQAPGWPGGLASRGYAVLSLAYFNEEGVPSQLANIPLEYFERALLWLRARPDVDPERIGLIGGSRGGEAALLIASMYPQLVRAVVATVPSSVAWNGCCDRGSGRLPAWTYRGTALPHMGADPELFASRDEFSRDTPLRMMPFFSYRLTDTAAVRRAAIPVERIGGPVLLISAREDRLWPSYEMSEQVMARLKAHGFKHEYRHLALENAGHLISRPYISVVEAPRASPEATTDFGGTPEGRARAHERAWAEILSFFDRHLGKRPQ